MTTQAEFGRAHVEAIHEREASGTVIRVAREPEYAQYVPGSGLGVAVFTVPALPGYRSIYLINEDGERLRHLRTETVDRVALEYADAQVAAIADGTLTA